MTDLVHNFVNDPTTSKRWVVMSSNKKNLLYDPTTQLPFCTSSKLQAEIMAREVRQDFGGDFYICELKQAVVLLAKHRYGLDVKSSDNSKELLSNVLKAVLTGSTKITGLN